MNRPTSAAAGDRGRGRAAVVLRRAGRRTNLGLLVLLVGSFGTGWLSFAIAQPAPAQLATFAHGLTGLGVVVLTPWKVVVVRRAPALRVASLVLIGAVLACLVAGFVEVFGGFGVIGAFGPFGGVSPIQVHVGAALVLVVLVTWHVLRHRRMRLRRVDRGRRNVLRTGGFVLAAGATWGALEGIGALAGSRSASRVATGSHRLPAADIPATIWLLDRVPPLDPTHQVIVEGVSVSVADLDSRGVPVAARLDCTSGWYAEATWSGVALSTLLDPDARAEARSILVTSVTGYDRRFPVADAEQLWLATRVEGRRLRPGNGAPVRLVVPGRRGFWWVKWVARVELSAVPAVAQPPFPLQ